ncbi:MAG: 5-methyltetrahydropteroyltriglutamate--homocysteine S-methyltransferase, partial [Pirellulales bacterium]|nr:5-methyltetrahydropteroyltriglutamate--homocysteine S-methyltransferase [Pirellulales bacterium]
MTTVTNLGFPRMGPNRELKKALESYWAGKIDREELLAAGRRIRQQNWTWQRDAGIDHIPSGDFSFYDQVLDTALIVGAVPPRFGGQEVAVDLDLLFAMARGTTARAGSSCCSGCCTLENIGALEMTKWFDTNYHYLVPEFEPDQQFTLASTKPVDEFLEAKALGIHTRPVLLGPVTFLRLGKSQGKPADVAAHLDAFLPVYEELLIKLAEAGADWVQFDEPCLVTDLSESEREALRRAYERLAGVSDKLQILVATYFGPLDDNLELALRLPVDALHVDLVRGREQFDRLLKLTPDGMILSLGLVDGRNVWKTDLEAALSLAERAVEALGAENVMIGPSCSLLHSPVDLAAETELDDELRSWLAFARQKLNELNLLGKALREGRESVAEPLAANARALAGRRVSNRTHNESVRKRTASIDPSSLSRTSPYAQRREAQRVAMDLPLFPTTTIGSFPQTPEIRNARAAFRRGESSEAEYDAFLEKTLVDTIRFQERIGLDVLVHGEAERTDMVEYFGQRLEGMAVTLNGWVQSYGSRCVKPPIIFGDVWRKEPITVEWMKRSVAATDRPVKAMLTGPITMLCWSFPRDDLARSESCRQLALAVRDEVADLEAAGAAAIQIDEPAFREGMPLRAGQRDAYLRWAVDCFRLASSVVADRTQIHTHMCYCEFNDIIDSIAALDADVISIETSRSQMELLDAFAQFDYPNEIGPGVYDIHSP